MNIGTILYSELRAKLDSKEFKSRMKHNKTTVIEELLNEREENTNLIYSTTD